jgi:Tfp pilus assembly protein PilX
MIFKRFLRKIGRKERGMILPLALVLLVAATLIVMPGLGFMYSLLTINSNAQQDVAAYYAADSGIQAVYWYWNTNPNNITSTYIPTIANPINGMTVTVVAVDSRAPDNSYDNYTITSSAASGSKTRAQVIALVKVPAAGNNIFSQAAASLNGDTVIDSGGHIISDGKIPGNYGNIWANGNVNVKNGEVGGTSCPGQGTASATGTVTVDQWSGCVGTKAPNQTTPVSYTVTTSNFTTPADNGFNYTPQSSSWANGGTPYTLVAGYVNGAANMAGSNTFTLTGNLHVKGNLSIGGSAVIKGAYTIIVDGELIVSGSASAKLVTAGNVPFIIVQGNGTTTKNPAVDISGSAEVAAIIYAPNGMAYLHGGTGSDGFNVYGSVIAKSIEVDSMTIEYLSGIHSETQIPGAGLGGKPLLIGYNYQ